LKAYFFVITPLNYLYALQASLDDRFAFEEKHLIVLSDYNRSLRQFKSIIDENQWDSVKYPWNGKNKKTKNKLKSILSELYNYITFRLIYRQIRQTDAIIFWGNYNHKYLKLIKLQNDLVFVLDDGFSTVNILRREENQVLKEKEFNNYSFYTVFNVESTKFKIVRHRLENITNYNYRPFFEDNIYFLGQPLVYNNVISAKKYIDYVNDIFKFYSNKGKNCYYLPHRSTNREYIPSNWNLLDFDFPIEYIDKLESQKTPGYFMTFYSTGVYNLMQLYNMDIQKCIFWEIPSDWINEKYKTDIENIYVYLKSNNYFVKNIKELTIYIND
jgi:hypothetical protein